MLGDLENLEATDKNELCLFYPQRDIENKIIGFSYDGPKNNTYIVGNFNDILNEKAVNENMIFNKKTIDNECEAYKSDILKVFHFNNLDDYGEIFDEKIFDDYSGNIYYFTLFGIKRILMNENSTLYKFLSGFEKKLIVYTNEQESSDLLNQMGIESIYLSGSPDPIYNTGGIIDVKLVFDSEFIKFMSNNSEN